MRKVTYGAAWPGVTLVKTDPGDFVRELKARPGGDICVLGGSDFARSLLAAGVIDEVGCNVHPVLLGSGVPLFVDCGRKIRLSLEECRQIHGGCVNIIYKVSEQRPRSARALAWLRGAA